MRKVFRMQYEPCNGLCYAPSHSADDENFESFNAMHELKNDKPRLAKLLADLTKVHDPLCGNENLRIAIDKDDIAEIYVGSFIHYGKLEMVLGDNLLATLEALFKLILQMYDTKDFKADIAADSGLGHEVCEHGQDAALKVFVLREAQIATTQEGASAYLLSLAGIEQVLV